MAMDQSASAPAPPMSRLRGLADDRGGQVSFSVIAVVLLVSSAIAGTYLANHQMEEDKQDHRRELLESMEDEIGKIVNELSLCSAGRAQSTMSAWSEFPINETRISDAFSREMTSYILSSFPRVESGITVEVENWTGGLYFIEQNTLDLIPADSASASSLSFEGQRMDYDRLPEVSAETLGVKTANPYYVAVGNFSVCVSAKDVSLARDCSFQRPVISALPFLESKLRAFESAMSGGFSDLSELVAYMLSVLAEVRVIEGYGQPMFSGGKNTSEILTELDVYRAVAVGLLLEQLRLFRTCDADFGQQVEDACGGNGLGLMAAAGSRGRTLDPADLFLWFIGMTEPRMDPTMIIAEALYGLADQVVLKLMEYMGWLGALDLVREVAGFVDATLDLVVSRLTGEDRALSAVVSWIRQSLDISSYDAVPPAVIFSPSADCSVPIREKVYYVQDVYGDLYPVWLGNTSVSVDIPEYDLLSSKLWREFFPEFKEHQTTFKRLASDSVMRLAFDIASASSMSLDGFVIDPTDGNSVFDQLVSSAGRVDLSLDPEAIVSAGRSLPMFSAQYDLASSFQEFVQSKGLRLVDLSHLMDGAYDELASEALSSARHSYIPGLAVPVQQQLEEIVRHDVEFDPQWDVGPYFRSMLDGMLLTRLDHLVAVVNSSVQRADDGFAGPMVDAVAAMLAFGADKFPGLEPLVERTLTQFAGQVLRQGELAGHKRTVYLDSSARFEFWGGDRAAAAESGGILEESVKVRVGTGLPRMQVVPYDQSTGYSSLSPLFPTDNLLVQLRRPWQYDRTESDYPNVHLTALDNMSATPYSTQWEVSVLGVIELVVCSDNSELQSLTTAGACARRDVRVEISLPIVVHSAWPLQLVAYNPSNTVLSDAAEIAKKFCDIVWDKLEPVLGWVKDGFERVFRFVSHAFEVLSSFATKLVRIVSSALQTLVETLQAFVQKIADSVLGKAVRVFIDLVGRVELRISLFGFVIIIQTNLPDLIYRHGNDLLRVIVFTDRLGPGLTFGVRVARLTDGSFDILANCTIAMKGLTIEVAVDPLMHIMRKFVEVHCSGRSWALDLAIPEVEPYELAEVSTADLPGVGAFLSNIPVPLLGVSASIEAGIRLKYSSPFPTDVVVNEIESNPQGDDSGKEWVELYNPLDKPRCVDGWTIETVHGRCSVIELEGTIAPNGLRVFTFPETAIDNGVAGDPFLDGDAIVVRNPAGAVIDLTPSFRDCANDARTNQRSWDGGPKWAFEQGSMDGSNGAPVLLATSDFIAKALFEAFRQSFAETKLEEVTASLDFVALFAKRVLHNFIENLLSLVKEIIHEVILYIEVVLGDASGAAGVGLRASFVVTGESIVDLLRWLIHSLATFVVNLGRASNPVAYPAFPQKFFSGLYLRFEALFEVGLPKMMRLVGAAGSIDGKFTCAASISSNLPALGKLVGRNWGNWSIDFGVYLERVPRDFAASYLSKDTGDFIDFWLVRARVYGL